MCVVSLARNLAEHRVVGGDIRGHECVGGVDARDALQSELFDESILHGQVSPFYASFCRRRVRADAIDVELIQRTPELRMPGAARRGGLIYAENARLVAIERQWLAMS